MKIGAAFGDHIQTEKTSRYHHYDEERPFAIRQSLLVYTLLIIGCILLVKLLTLQILQGNYYRNLADANRTRTKVIHAPRGIIFDRNGKALVYNIPGFRQINGTKTILLSHDKAIDLLSKGSTQLEIDSLRQYPLKESASHVLGYVGQISQEELASHAISEYQANDLIGKTGLEQYYEPILKGIDGRELIEVDAVGRKIRTLGQTDPIPGKDITLTLDADLQDVAYNALPKDSKGTVIATTPTGEVLAMVSRPSYDPNLFTMDENYVATTSSYQTIDAVLQDTHTQPLMNRAISGTYPPGSTFKLVTAASALENHVIDKNFSVEDTGIITIGTFSFANWFYTDYGKKDGTVNVVKAIARSNDIFFYKIADMINPDRLGITARLFGLGKPLGIDLYGEARGIVPDKAWKQKIMHEQWYLGDSYHYGIGQGYLLTTPLQVNVLTATLANNGIVPKPHLLKTQNTEQRTKKILSSETIGLIEQGMVESCREGGVAWPLFSFKVKNPSLVIDGKNIREVKPASGSAVLADAKDYREVTVACKTGTAQHGDQATEPHAWITLFAPAYDPQIVVTVLVESGGQGSSIASPVAKKVLEAWFADD
jgi:penicillin-binding protein 2